LRYDALGRELPALRAPVFSYRLISFALSILGPHLAKKR
jgi:hypothetical protein